MHTVSFAINYWSRGQVQGKITYEHKIVQAYSCDIFYFKGLFLRHEGYLGAIGAFLKATECGNISIQFSKKNSCVNICLRLYD